MSDDTKTLTNMKKLTLLAAFAMMQFAASAQSVGVGTTTPNSSAILEVSSTTKGMLMPRMTTAQRNAILSPAVGLTILNIDDKCMDVYTGSGWIKNCGLKLGDSAVVPADSWIQKADFGGVARASAFAFSIGGKGYFGTGETAVSSTSNDFWQYDTIANAWSQKANFGGTTRASAVGLATTSKGYVGTGFGPNGNGYTNDFWEYDPAGNVWTQKANFGGVPRNGATGFVINGKCYIGLGVGGTVGNAILPIDFWEYDPSTNIWTQKANFAGLRRTSATGFSVNNKGYVACGNAGNFLNDLWEFDPGSAPGGLGTWTQRPSFPGLGREHAVSFTIGNKAYVGTGSYVLSGRQHLNDFWEYDPGTFGSTGTWTQRASFGGLARGFAVGFSIGNKGYIGSGSIAGSFGAVTRLNDFWEYNPDSYKIPAFSTALPNTGSSASQISDDSWTRTPINNIYSNIDVNKVGIGFINPNEKLSINGNLRVGNQQWNSIADNRVIKFGDGDYTTIGERAGDDQLHLLGTRGIILSTLNDIEALRITINGNVGIGTNAPTQKLHVIGNILASGTITPSDVRYKKNIQPLGNALAKLRQLNGVTYTLNSAAFPEWNFSNQLQYGLIAQEVEKVFPEMVHTISDKGYKGVDYVKLIPVLLESIKEQQAQIDLLMRKIEKIENK
jgi:N-acetylneuraminic acid mutarotase